MKTFKYFLAGFLAAMGGVIAANLVLDQRQQPPAIIPEPKFIYVSPSPTPVKLITVPVTPVPKPTPTPEPVVTRLQQLSGSDELSAIKRDLEQTDFTDLDKELPEIESAFANLYRQ